MLAPSLHSVANWVLPRFALSCLGGDLASLNRELGAPSLCSSTPRGGGTISLRSTVNSVLRHFVPPHLRGGAISFRSTVNSVLRHFIPLHLGGAISLRSTAKWVLPRFAPSHPGGRPHFARSLHL